MEAKLDGLIDKINRQEEKWNGWEKHWEQMDKRWEEANKRWEEVNKWVEEEKRQRDKEREMKEEMMNMQVQIGQMAQKIDELEYRSRRTNLAMKGIKEGKNETWTQIEGKVSQVLEEKLDLKGVGIVRAHRVGKLMEGRDRPIVMKFVNEKERDEVLRRKNKLKSTTIYI